jgi:xanthine dehydrogenase YagR molybdenum-binding subunit
MITFPKSSQAPGPLVGQPVSRIDGRAKVTGAAKYAAEINVPGLTYGVVVSSTIAKGTIVRIDVSRALALSGVLHVFTHENRPNLAWFDRSYADLDAPAGSPFRPLYDDRVLYSGQPVALVVAETFELARHAASLIEIRYEAEAHRTDLHAHRSAAREPKKWTLGREAPPKPRGDADKALAGAAVRVDEEYSAPAEHHNPMEMHATTVVQEDDGTLTVFEKTQGVLNTHSYLKKVFGLSGKQVRVRSQYVGGAFGSGLRPQYQLFLAVMAARELHRSVRVSLTRQQMFTFGHRPETIQRVALGASEEGKLEAVIHKIIAETSQFEDYVETVVNWSGLLYQCDNVRTDHRVVPLDVYTPLDMRAPGAAWGVYALECAMDELAVKAGIDPLDLRLRNYAERDQEEKKPFSSKELRACYAQAAERFGWARRTAAPRSMRDGDKLVGWGMATGVWDALQLFANAQATLSIDGTLTVASATSDIGTGTATVMAQIAAGALGLPIESVTVKLGDSSLPWAPLEGGSWTAVTVGSAVKGVCDKIGRHLFDLARKMDGSPLAGAKRKNVVFACGGLHLANDPSRRVTIAEAMRSGGELKIQEKVTALPSPKRLKYSTYVHSAVFAEVKVDEDLGIVQVTRVVSAVAGGRVLNPKTARSQILGAVVGGIGMALEEETLADHRFGRFMNHSFGEYHVPVNADVRDIDVIFVDEPDEHVNALGAKGLGEIGIVGVAAAVANAVYHATGRRIRKLPITLDLLL